MNEIYEDSLLVDANIDFIDFLDVQECIPIEIESSGSTYNENDFELCDEVVSEIQMYCANLNELQDTFISFVKKEETKMFGKSFVDNFFYRYKCPIEEIVNKSHTELWQENTIYGIQFQAYLCVSLNISLPTVPLRKRKNPSKINNKKEKFRDHILEYFTQLCDYCSSANNVSKRLAPRDQISLLVFILDILNHPYFQSYVRWKDKSSLTFEIIKPKAVAYFWMVVKDNEMCSFENFTRAIRFKRNAGVFKHINHKKRRVYQFHQKALREYKMKRYSNKLSANLLTILGVV